MNVCDVFRYHAQVTPGRPALIDGDRTITFSELSDLLERTATYLIGLGLRPGDRVGCALKEDADHVIALLGILRAGLVYVPMDWRAPAVERERVAARFSIALTLAPDCLPPSATPTRTVDEDWWGAVAATPSTTHVAGDGDEAALIGLSSGTTGEPVGLVHSHRVLFSQSCSRWNSIVHAAPRRYFSALPLFFSGGRQLVLDHLIFGATVILYPSLFAAEEFVEQIERYEATITLVVPTVLRWLLELPTRQPCLLPDLEALLLGAAPVRAEEKLATLDHVSAKAHDAYGATGAGWMSLARPQDIRRHPNSIGLGTFFVERQLVDKDDCPVAVGEVGRMRCRGPGIVQTEGSKDGWLYTGDLATENADGYLFLKGRAADLIIRGGANVLPEEVEKVLLSDDNVVEAAVVGWPSPVFGEEVAAYVVLRRPAPTDGLLKRCKSVLAPYKVPSEIFAVDALPRTSSGKVKKRVLVDRLPERQEV